MIRVCACNFVWSYYSVAAFNAKTERERECVCVEESQREEREGGCVYDRAEERINRVRQNKRGREREKKKIE